MAELDDQLDKLVSWLEKGHITQAQFEERRDALFSAGESPAPRTSAPVISDSIGAYRILGELGRGGMGVVYRAKHRTAAMAKRQGGEVAIKVLHAQYAQDEAFRDRFEREAGMGGKLDHPGIVKVYDLVIDGGNLALVMDLAEGRPLSEVIGQETGPIPWEQAWPMFKQMLDAVAYAHDHKVVHRDIKPENVVVSADNRLKILDFGIAKDLESGKTKTGTGMGTVDYMAPEQYTDASKVDQRADIYALGMTLYEMLAGRLPWDSGTTEFQVMTLKSRGDFPPPTDFYPEIPAGVVQVVRAATAVEPAERIQTVNKIIKMLKSQEGEGGAAFSEMRDLGLNLDPFPDLNPFPDLDPVLKLKTSSSAIHFKIDDQESSSPSGDAALNPVSSPVSDGELFHDDGFAGGERFQDPSGDADFIVGLVGLLSVFAFLVWIGLSTPYITGFAVLIAFTYFSESSSDK